MNFLYLVAPFIEHISLTNFELTLEMRGASVPLYVLLPLSVSATFSPRILVVGTKKLHKLKLRS